MKWKNPCLAVLYKRLVGDNSTSAWWLQIMITTKVLTLFSSVVIYLLDWHLSRGSIRALWTCRWHGPLVSISFLLAKMWWAWRQMKERKLLFHQCQQSTAILIILVANIIMTTSAFDQRVWPARMTIVIWNSQSCQVYSSLCRRILI